MLFGLQYTRRSSDQGGDLISISGEGFNFIPCVELEINLVPKLKDALRARLTRGSRRCTPPSCLKGELDNSRL